LTHLKAPEFYAEISFLNSGYQEIVYPQIASIYYPHSLLQASSSKPRTTVIGIDIASPLSPDPFKSASVAIVLPAIVPGPDVLGFAQDRMQSPWVFRPLESVAVKGVDLPTIHSHNGRYLPVSMKGSVNEVGDPSLFLASLNSAFGASTGSLTSTVMGGISLSGAPSSIEKQTEQAGIDAQKAHATALSAVSAFVKACSSGAATEADVINRHALFEAAVSAQRASNLAASLAGGDAAGLKFDQPEKVDGKGPDCN
jgi:hypothetical protein